MSSGSSSNFELIISSSGSSSNFELIINNALNEYKRHTKHDLREHPLATKLQYSNTPSAVLAVLQQQIQGIEQSRSRNERWTRWLDPTVDVLCALSGILGDGVSLVFPPATLIFAGVGILLSTAKDVRASQDIVIDIFERIEMFFRRLEIYAEVPPTLKMMDVVVRILAEVLSILGIAMKEITQARIIKFAKRLIGRTEVEDALKRLDKLTREEGLITSAQNLKDTHAVHKDVKGVKDVVVAIDNGVARVDNRIRDVDDGLKVVGKNVARVIADGKITAKGIDQVKRNQLRQDLRRWLSPPDPSTNHNIACNARHEGTATWFFRGNIFREWKSSGPLLWIHGKPGSGKSILCSTIIQDIRPMCEGGRALMAYFYFDFRDAKKQRVNDLLSSLLIQLSSQSDPCCDILSRLYKAHDEGVQQPSYHDLTRCLKEMLTFPGQCPIYLIMDALDESPDTSGIPSHREMVLQLLKELVDLSLPNLHICVTSRPEFDIRNVLEPLTSRRVSLHDQSGQKEDIAEYVRSIVYSDSEQIMRRWRKEDKELVIKTLSERADGMFRWAFCQLEALRRCLPPNVRRTLNELPESLDETYERVLREIKKPNRDHARRLLQCLVVAIRPLGVAELAEVLAVDFRDAEGIPKLKHNWRWEDQEQALLTLCSSLIAIIDTGRSRVVQFSHFSVKEYLTSTRLATSSGDFSRYHVDLEPAHTILAQACMSGLLQANDHADVERSSRLAKYAAEHWVTHAQFMNVSSLLRKAMGYLFDPGKPYFTAWLQLHDIDNDLTLSSSFNHYAVHSRSSATPLYYASLCGFQDLVKDLVIKYPQHVNTRGGNFMTPLIAALARRHFQTAELLRHNGADVDVRGEIGRTPLHSAAWNGDLEMVRVLLNYKADVNARTDGGWTPIHCVSEGTQVSVILNIHQSLPGVARLLLEHGADANAQLFDSGRTPLHVAMQHHTVEVVRVLLEQGANVGAEDSYGRTPFYIASTRGYDEVMKLLSEHSAK